MPKATAAAAPPMPSVCTAERRGDPATYVPFTAPKAASATPVTTIEARSARPTGIGRK
jgi:hypothetical protein